MVVNQRGILIELKNSTLNLVRIFSENRASLWRSYNKIDRNKLTSPCLSVLCCYCDVKETAQPSHFEFLSHPRVWNLIKPRYRPRVVLLDPRKFRIYIESPTQALRVGGHIIFCMPFSITKHSLLFWRTRYVIKNLLEVDRGRSSKKEPCA